MNILKPETNPHHEQEVRVNLRALNELSDKEIKEKSLIQDQLETEEEENKEVSAKRAKKKQRKNMLKSLPVFASADDYAQYLDQDSD